MAMGLDKLNATVVEKVNEVEKLETEFKTFMEGLQQQAKEAKEKMDEKVKALKDSGLKAMEEVLFQTSVCGPANLDMCDDANKTALKKYMAMDATDVKAEIKTAKAAVKEVESEWEKKSSELMESLQGQYKEASEKKDSDVKEIEASGLKLMQSVL